MAAARRAVVVGSGPNGLTAAATLARAGIRVTVLEAEDVVGGGTRSGELTLPGLLHDHCSAIHPLAVGAPSLAGTGVAWGTAAVDLAHPLDDGTAGVMLRDIGRTARGLGRDGRRWRRWFGAPFDPLAEDLLRPLLSGRPRHPLRAARFGLLAATPAAALARGFATPQARALLAGVAAHAARPLHRPMSSAAAVLLIGAGHRHGWPVAIGGSRAISDALAAIVVAHGGEILTGRRVDDLGELPDADVVLLDLAPAAVAGLAGDRMPARIARAFRRYGHGPGTFKIDLAVERGIPWTNAACRRAVIVHAAGPADELAGALRDVDRGHVPTSPFVVVSQQSLADPARARGTLHPVSAYTAVPHGFDGDATQAILTQIERFAPALSSHLEAVVATTPDAIARSNANLAGGDILTGATTMSRALFGSRPTLSPYSTGIPNAFICSAATPPGPGAHGMCGHHAARAALASLGARRVSAS